MNTKLRYSIHERVLLALDLRMIGGAFLTFVEDIGNLKNFKVRICEFFKEKKLHILGQ